METNYWNRCDACGRLIAPRDLESGAAVRFLDIPDSPWTAECYTTLCFRHAPRAYGLPDEPVPNTRPARWRWLFDWTWAVAQARRWWRGCRPTLRQMREQARESKRLSARPDMLAAMNYTPEEWER